MRATINQRTIERLKDFLRSVEGKMRNSADFSDSAIESIGSSTSPSFTIDDIVNELISAYFVMRDRLKISEGAIRILSDEKDAVAESLIGLGQLEDIKEQNKILIDDVQKLKEENKRLNVNLAQCIEDCNKLNVKVRSMHNALTNEF
jgi:hypothetical protein